MPFGEFMPAGDLMGASGAVFRITAPKLPFPPKKKDKDTPPPPPPAPPKAGKGQITLVVDEWGSWYAPLPGSNPGFLVQ